MVEGSVQETSRVPDEVAIKVKFSTGPGTTYVGLYETIHLTVAS